MGLILANQGGQQREKHGKRGSDRKHIGVLKEGMKSREIRCCRIGEYKE
jgi:hypothetical protein